MIDHLGMEAADIAQVTALGFPKADPEPPLVDLGCATIDSKKPVILCVGHNVLPATEIVDYARANRLDNEVEICGLCCTAQDVTRYYPKAKIIGPISWQLRFIRSGLPDVIVLDEQCIRTDCLIEAERIKAPIIATSEKNCIGLPNRTDDTVDEIVTDLVERKSSGVLILNSQKAGEVAVRTAIMVAPIRNRFKTIPDVKDVVEGAKTCRNCNDCRRACPGDLNIMEAVNEASRGKLEALANLYDVCMGCGRCESACEMRLPLHSYVVKAGEKKLKEERFKIRAGRGAIGDIEIRKVGRPIVFGEIPGVIGVIGCSNYPHGGKEIADLCEEFANRRYIVVTSGCARYECSYVQERRK
jgi:acetyl-CoA decarbonylase/synthase complex subunit alpha